MTKLSPQISNMLPPPVAAAPPVEEKPTEIAGEPDKAPRWQKPDRKNLPLYVPTELKTQFERQVKQTALDVGGAPLNAVHEAVIRFAMEHWDEVTARI